MTTSHLQLPPYQGDSERDAQDEAPDTRTFERHHVTAILVCHDGARWLPETLAALTRLNRRPQRTVVADTGSHDGSRRLVTSALGERSVVKLARSAGYGEAVRAGVELADRPQPHSHRAGTPPDESAHPGRVDGEAPGQDVVEWLWLLHDDSAPEPEALRALLAAVDASGSVGIAGPKVRGWSKPDELREVGITVGGGGRRETGLERHELDQGQHDARRDVLAVGTAGMLVRRDVWDQLGGFDPALRMFRDDLDLGWRANLAGHRVIVVPEAVLHHAEASAHGLRTAAAARNRVHRADRRSALRVLLANAPWYSLPWHWLRLLVGSVFRVLGLLLSKAPGEAADEIVAAATVLGNPIGVYRARSARAKTRAVPARELRHLLAPPMSGFLHGFEVVVSVLSRGDNLGPSSGSALESGPVSDDTEELVARPSRIRAFLVHPGAQLWLALLFVSLIAFRSIAFGDGALQGGSLLPSSGTHSLWSTYAAGWHDVGVGSSLSAPPYLVVIAALGTVLLGKAWLAVELLFVLSVPLAGAIAYGVLGRLISNRWVRLLAAVTYALLPAVTGGLATGQLGLAVAAWLLPLTGWIAARSLGLGSRTARDHAGDDGRPTRPGSLSLAWVAGLALSVLVAFVPSLWLFAAVVGAGAVLIYRPLSWRIWGRLGAILVVPPVLLVPWSLHLFDHPATWLLGIGAPLATEAPASPAQSLPAWHLAVANPGGAGVPAGWITIPLLVAGLAALLRGDRRRLVATAWLLVAAGLVAGVLVYTRTVVPPSLGWPVPIWPGVATLVGGGGLVLAAAVGADGMRARLSGYGFGWRQGAVSLLVGVTALVPLALAAGWLVRGVDGQLQRGPVDVLPAYVVAAGLTPGRPRALVLQASPAGAFGVVGSATAYALVPAQGRELGDADVAPSAALTAGLRPALSALLGGHGTPVDVKKVASYGIGFLVVNAPVSPVLAGQLDQLPGLAQVSATGGTAVWRLLSPGYRVELARPPASTIEVNADPLVPTTTVDTDVPDANAVSTTGVGQLILAEAASSGWVATADGRAAKGGRDGWQQVFAVPADVTHLTVSYSDGRGWWLLGEGIVLLAVIVLALPTRRSRGLDRVGRDDVPVVDLPVVEEDGR